jgi:hypothetical protein
LNTLDQYLAVVNACKDVYLKKANDYGTSWRVYRTISIADQIYIKAWRIRQIQENGVQQIEDSIESEFMAMVNYGLMALIQLTLEKNAPTYLSLEDAEKFYDTQATEVRELMMKKNHDYGEAWRELSQESFVDLILTKILRIRQILANDGKTLISEGIDANFADIVNYSIFALIKIKEGSASR